MRAQARWPLLVRRPVTKSLVRATMLLLSGEACAVSDPHAPMSKAAVATSAAVFMRVVLCAVGCVGEVVRLGGDRLSRKADCPRAVDRVDDDLKRAYAIRSVIGRRGSTFSATTLDKAKVGALNHAVELRTPTDAQTRRVIAPAPAIRRTRAVTADIGRGGAARSSSAAAPAAAPRRRHHCRSRSSRSRAGRPVPTRAPVRLPTALLHRTARPRSAVGTGWVVAERRAAIAFGIEQPRASGRRMHRLRRPRSASRRGGSGDRSGSR
ncbi:MAG: hypothetical protein QOD83_3221 [Solirubrobacteraceae bacterium]|nr:hypothetical protein [Solirubrobacteraceae bacterium]